MCDERRLERDGEEMNDDARGTQAQNKKKQHMMRQVWRSGRILHVRGGALVTHVSAMEKKLSEGTNGPKPS